VGFREVVQRGSRCFCTALALNCQVPTWQLSVILTLLTKKDIKIKYIFI
jgi:hypothetical protein